MNDLLIQTIKICKSFQCDIYENKILKYEGKDDSTVNIL